MTSAIVWRGEQAFRLVGTNRHEDTLRIRPIPGREDIFRLRLPTLCITYADIEFANDIGGEQLRWPDSAMYGPKYFDPPVAITGQADVERVTWIRGAHHVVIGPDDTVIDWHAFRGLVVPRLHISVRNPIEAMLEVDEAVVGAESPIQVDIIQIADGRSIGGLSVVKRHPDWHETLEETPSYRLWVRVVEFGNGLPLVEARLAFFRWEEDQSRVSANGAFVPTQEEWTDGKGSTLLDQRPADAMEAVTLAMDGWRATAKVWRAQDRQPVNLLIRAARLEPTEYPREVPGARRNIYAAAYNLDEDDTLEWLAEAFRYRDIAELAGMNRVSTIDPAAPIPLPGWYFLHAQQGDTLDSLAEAFELEPGWPRSTGRHHRPSNSVVLEHEIVAIPGPDFVVGRTPA